MSARSRHTRPGFALLVVLWIMVGAASLGLTITLAARESVAAAHNRTSAARAMWRAHDCLERARAVIHHALQEMERPQPRQTSTWLFLDSVVARSGLTANLPCDVALRAAGGAIDVNVADADMVTRLLRASGIPSTRADSMTDALLDWRDADDIVRPLGAEVDWYANAKRAGPRNGPLVSGRELVLVRGFDSASGLDSLLSVEPARIVLPRAPLAVIAALPGIQEEALARIAERRLQGAWPVELIALSAELSPAVRATLLTHYAELARLTTLEPDAWIVTSRGRDALSRVTAVIETRLVRAGTRAAIVRRRSWVE